ncbi:pyridoxal phosphate-dependent transferase [Radiomyces spectabilis]|uniref:pyridoxal phosphate-dependent transferase n=1 Tax=Radiomyces spectabilis TaxID=64574 RepID=UPI00221FB3AD|nr:pyridoxal phosphate-dependent transferase [Radiomyces spectabilis]KAI8381077.1 pyridoxal phosphate-dependent transferase [Radiomyces spectabilis]
MSVVPEPPTQVGAAIPAHTPHAVSVMFPKWQDNIYYEEGNPIVTAKMECGYPRFFIHPLIQQLCARLLAKFGQPTEDGMLFPSRKVAERCRDFMKRYYEPAHSHSGLLRIAEFDITPADASSELQPVRTYILLFPKDAFKVAKQYWQHAGDNISSRMAEYCLRILDENQRIEKEKEALLKRPKGNRRYQSAAPSAAPTPKKEDSCEAEHLVYVEERYGRNLPIQFADRAKRALRRRIAGVITEAEEENMLADKATQSDLKEQRNLQGDRGIKGIAEDDVYLFPCGMSAIYHAHRYAMTIGNADLKSVCFGFPYTDTLKILQKFGAGCHFYGLGEDQQIDELEALLQSGDRILSLFCELPSNPLLKSPNMRRLRALADQYDFLIVVDETIGNFCNVAALEWADMVVSSLTKVFSGDSNVMGGSMVLNPNRKHYHSIKSAIEADFEDLIWCEDAIFMERNSRTFKARSNIINENAEALCDFLVNHPKVQSVYYPKFVSRENYDAVKNVNGGGYGGLFSVVLQHENAASQFYDNLHCAKGPSLGTNFTLASPYTILAHYTELDWAAQFGVPRHLVRVSVGLEERDRLLKMFKDALDAVEA